MKILFLSISTAVKDMNNRGIYPDLIGYFSDKGHDLFIVCPSERRLNQATNLKVEGNVSTLSVKTLNITKSNFIEKGIATILIEHQFSKAIKEHFNTIKFDLILYATPPISFNFLIKKLKAKHSAMSYLMLKDIFPQNAVDLGMIKKEGFIYRFFQKKEQSLYAVSDYIGCMSAANKEYVLKHTTLNEKKVEICPNAIKIVDRKTNFAKKEIFDKYTIPENVPVFLYGGNLGVAQGISFLIEVLESNTNRDDCFFLIVGGGNRFNLIQNWVLKNEPRNVKLINQLDRKEFDVLESFCDVGMIFLDHKFTIPNFPSRILSYMECKMPLLIATDKSTDLGKIASENKFGLSSTSNDLSQYNENLNYFITNSEDRERMGKNAYNFLVEHYDVSVSYNAIMSHFKMNRCI
jgi:glycosyltransferase involved in cell wall biosynthesis